MGRRDVIITTCDYFSMMIKVCVSTKLLFRRYMVPHLTTALSGPLLDLEQHILDSMPAIEHWMRGQWRDHEAPFYASVDLRNSGFKLAPVDTNLFPGGFNNLNPEFLPLCVQAATSAIEKICPEAQKLLIIPENHTRNTFYLQNVATLHLIMRQAGLKVRIGSINPDITSPVQMALSNGSSILIEPVRRLGQRLTLPDFDPCAVLLNNDLSAGIPEILRGLDQWLLPPLQAGWAVRRKSTHFSQYDGVADEFAQLLGVDPWLINPYFSAVEGVDFSAGNEQVDLAAAVDDILTRTRKKYQEYGIENRPFVIIKADAGTYGMGIMSVHEASEVLQLNRKQRNRMAIVKEGLKVSRVMVQEGVYTFENINEAVAEPVVYMMDHYVVGGFYRVHTNRGQDENLNAPGMHFVPLAFETACCLPDPAECPEVLTNRFYAYGVIARLALLAAARELEDTLSSVEAIQAAV